MGSKPASSSSGGGNPGGGNGGGTNPPAPLTIATSGTVWQLGANHYEGLSFSLNAAAAMSGSITATNGVTAYLFDPTDYQAYSSSGSASSYEWTSGHVSSGRVNTNLGTGTWSLVFDNTNVLTTSSVQVTSNIVATAS
jgi:hypothetical protein